LEQAAVAVHIIAGDDVQYARSSAATRLVAVGDQFAWLVYGINFSKLSDSPLRAQTLPALAHETCAMP
jgi:hypothetical protein